MKVTVSVLVEDGNKVKFSKKVEAEADTEAEIGKTARFLLFSILSKPGQTVPHPHD